MEPEQQKRDSDGDDGAAKISMAGVELTPRQAGTILNEMSDGKLWPFLVAVLHADRLDGEKAALDDLSMTQDHTEWLFRVQGARRLADNLLDLKNALREALSSEG